jgi:hypothetical protein
MSHSSPTPLVLEDGWTQTHSTELQDFTKINATLWPMIFDF